MSDFTEHHRRASEMLLDAVTKYRPPEKTELWIDQAIKEEEVAKRAASNSFQRMLAQGLIDTARKMCDFTHREEFDG